MHSDPIADLLTRIRNASMAHHYSVSAPYSKLKAEVLRVMKQYGFIENFTVEENDKFKQFDIVLKPERSSTTFKKVSKPGQRIYVKNSDLKPIKRGLGIAILSTSKGVMSNVEARKQNLGGELICEIY